MMLWLHLFNSESRLLSAGVSDLTIGGISLAYLFSKACNPVSIFIILSGYGLRISFLSGRLSIKNITKRLCYLYCFYWVTLALFVTIGAFISPDRYPKGVSELILNITSYSSSYNGETWFLFPYFCLNLTCLFLFKLQDKIGNIATLIASGLLYGIACYIISRYIVLTQTYDSVLSHIVTYLSFYFPFYLGSFMGDLWGEETRREEKRSNTIYYVLIVVVFLLRIFLSSAVFTPFTSMLLILLIAQIRPIRPFHRFFSFLGKYSMPIWLIHSYFCYYLFSEFIYGLQYPIAIFIALVSISLAVAILLKKATDMLFQNKFSAYKKQK